MCVCVYGMSVTLPSHRRRFNSICTEPAAACAATTATASATATATAATAAAAAIGVPPRSVQLHLIKSLYWSYDVEER